MNIHELPSIVLRGKKRVGRGHGSGKVKTSGRGQKGQKARGSVRPGFEGGQSSLRHRLPFLRGKGRNASKRWEVAAVPITRLLVFSSGETVTLQSLKEKGVIEGTAYKVKIIGNTSFTLPLTVEVPCTKGAKVAIEKAGGTVNV